MTYRKFKADYLWLGDRMADPDSVLITTTEGRVQAVVTQLEAGEGVEALDGLLCPGFVNCHCHLELSHLRGVIPERTGLVDFLLAVIGTRAAGAAAGLQEKVSAAIASAEQEMLSNGIVAVGDICNTPETLRQKKAGRLRYRNFIETMGFVEKAAADRFAVSLTLLEAFDNQSGGLNSVVPHAPYSVSPALFRRIADFPGNTVLTIHNQESDAENEFLLTGRGDFLRLYEALGLDLSWFRGTGQRSLESVRSYFQPRHSLILVHNVATTKDDLEHLTGGPGLIFCLCPNANLYIGGRLPDVRLLIDRGCRIVVGTDSLASNQQLSILEELKCLQRSFPWLETGTLLRWATIEGAKALQMDDVVGSFAPGKVPGVLLLQGLDGRSLAQATKVKRLV
jgi:cytosine/adenosine deaminase-related metal-dependent hydrolase